MTSAFKFGWNPEDPQKYEYPDVWSQERTTGPDRLVIAPSNDHISLMLVLSRVMMEPFGFLYVLTVPRGPGTAARYQCAEPVIRQDSIETLLRFKQFFEGDGRHHVWLKSISNSDQLVYDKHNVIYAYGQFPAFEDILSRRGMVKSRNGTFPDTSHPQFQFRI
jgi:hypothetical protein